MTNDWFNGKIFHDISNDDCWRSQMSSFKDSLYEKRSFIYQIGEEYYAIGANTFAKITDSQELDNIELLQNAYDKGNDRQIVKYFEKIMRIANSYRGDAKEHYRIQDRLFKVIDELETHDEAAFRALQEQVFRFDELCGKYQQQI